LSLKCCNRLCQLIETVPLYDTETRCHRALVIGRCKNPKCGCIKAEFIYWDKNKEKFVYQKIPKKDVKEVIEKFKKSPYLINYETSKKNGNFANMHWKYQKNGNMYDFNDVFIEKVKTELKTYGE